MTNATQLRYYFDMAGLSRNFAQLLQRSTPSIGRMDAVGAFASLACAVHCIALPFVLTMLPLFGLSFLADHNVEKAVVVFAVVLALFSLCWGSRIHGKRYTLWFLLIAVCFFFVAHFFAPGHHYLLMAGGGLSLASGHLLNMRFCKTCTHCSC